MFEIYSCKDLYRSIVIFEQFLWQSFSTNQHPNQIQKTIHQTIYESQKYAQEQHK